jgi:hypothetical protein
VVFRAQLSGVYEPGTPTDEDLATLELAIVVAPEDGLLGLAGIEVCIAERPVSEPGMTPKLGLRLFA